MNKLLKKLKDNCKSIDLVYVDYNSSFNDDLKSLNGILKGDDEEFFDNNMDWLADSEHEQMQYTIDEVFTEEEKEQIMEDDDLHEEIRNYLYSIDSSNVIKDLMKNTGNKFFFYDLGIELEELYHREPFNDYNVGDDEIQKTVNGVCKFLKIKNEDDKKSIRMMYEQAGNGNLVIFFSADVGEVYEEMKKDGNKITFIDPTFCIMDRENGSGDDVMIKGKFSFSFDKTRLNLDEGVGGYSYSGDVCGLVGGSYPNDFTITTDKRIKNPNEKEEKTKIEQYNENIKKWDKEKKETGKCSCFDPRYNSHNTEYINEFPARNQCKDCGRCFYD
jgi:hypothetical protein